MFLAKLCSGGVIYWGAGLVHHPCIPAVSKLIILIDSLLLLIVLQNVNSTKAIFIYS